jgi:dienelactone hydrolase
MRPALIWLLLSGCSGPSSGANDGGVDLSTITGPPVDGGGDLSASDGAKDAYGPYDRAGPYSFTRSTVHVDTGSRQFDEELHLTDAPGARPVVLLAPGVLQPATAYRPFAERLASHGFVVLVRDDPGLLVDTTVVADDLVHVGTAFLAAPPAQLTGRVDLSKLGLAGHSRGGKASLLASEGGLKGKVKAWFGLDPVDTSLLGGGQQARDTIGSIGIPIALLGASVSASCAPAADNYTVLYAAASSPAVALTGVGAGHTQLEDQTFCSACNLCTPNGTADDKVVLAYAVRYLTAFFARELTGDAAVGATFDGAGASVDIMTGLITRMNK